MQIYRKCRAVSYLEILFNVAIKIVLSNHYTKNFNTQEKSPSQFSVLTSSAHTVW